jgi:hypothetical protein
MLTIHTVYPSRFNDEDALRHRLNDAWLTTGIMPVTHIVADPDTFEDDAICAPPLSATTASERISVNRISA